MTFYHFPVAPVPKPRQTQADVWKKRPAVVRYRAFADALRERAKGLGFAMPEHGASVVFLVPMPDSWSKAKRDRMEGTPHQQKPDVDNLLKAFLDALCGEDCTIWQLSGVEKRWDKTGAISVRVAE